MEMFMITKYAQMNYSAEYDNDRIKGHNLRVNKRVKTVVRQGSFTQRVVDAWNGLLGK